MKQKLLEISPSDIDANPDNPRFFFRQEELESLYDSISTLGIQVPITVYQEKDRYVLLDGERRWRCSKKLNMKAIPAIVQPKPSRLENLITMSNIHALREQWDYYTIAQNLKKIKEQFWIEKKQKPNESQLSQVTGLSRGQIRRCQMLLDLPAEHQKLLQKDLALPKSQQKFSEDFFLEMERSLKTVVKRFPEFASDLKEIRQTLIDKYEDKVINAVTDFRQLTKIATAPENTQVSKALAHSALTKIFKPENRMGIKEAYNSTTSEQYQEKSARKHVRELIEFLEEASSGKRKKWSPIDAEFAQDLNTLYNILKIIIKG